MRIVTKKFENVVDNELINSYSKYNINIEEISTTSVLARELVIGEIE